MFYFTWKLVALTDHIIISHFIELLNTIITQMIFFWGLMHLSIILIIIFLWYVVIDFLQQQYLVAYTVISSILNTTYSLWYDSWFYQCCHLDAFLSSVALFFLLFWNCFMHANNDGHSHLFHIPRPFHVCHKVLLVFTLLFSLFVITHFPFLVIYSNC